MLTPEIQHKLNQLWDKFSSHGISTPLAVCEQIGYLLYLRMQDKEKSSFDFLVDAIREPYTWGYVRAIKDNKERLQYMATEVFPEMQKPDANKPLSIHLASATFLIPNGILLQEAMRLIDNLYDEISREASGSAMAKADIWGSAFEYLLNQTVAGSNGMGYTPPHIVKLVCDMARPVVTDTICDPACGNGELLAGAYRQFLCAHTGPEHRTIDEDGFAHGIEANLLSNKADWHKIKQNTFRGYDTDISRVRLATMNLLLRGIDFPLVENSNILEAETNESSDKFSLILSNLPTEINRAKTKLINSRIRCNQVELLFIDRIISMLSPGGRAFLILPGGFLSADTKEHIAVRQLLLKLTHVQAVISIAAGVFLPANAEGHCIICFQKKTQGAKKQRPVWFYQLISDGYSTDGRKEKLDINPLPEIANKFRQQLAGEDLSTADRSGQYFFVPEEEIARREFRLDQEYYRQTTQSKIEEKTIGQQVKQLWQQLAQGVITVQQYQQEMRPLALHPIAQQTLQSLREQTSVKVEEPAATYQPSTKAASSPLVAVAKTIQQSGADTITMGGTKYSLLEAMNAQPPGEPFTIESLQLALQIFTQSQTRPAKNDVEGALQNIVKQFIQQQYAGMPFNFQQLHAEMRMNSIDIAYMALHTAVWSLLRTNPAYIQQVYFEPDMERKFKEAYNHLRNKKADNGIYLLQV